MSTPMLTADELQARYAPEGEGEHPTYPQEDWRYEVANQDTRLGYWAWVAHAQEADAAVG